MSPGVVLPKHSHFLVIWLKLEYREARIPAQGLAIKTAFWPGFLLSWGAQREDFASKSCRGHIIQVFRAPGPSIQSTPTFLFFHDGNNQSLTSNPPT